jgi:magnesium transporter
MDPSTATSDTPPVPVLMPPGRPGTSAGIRAEELMLMPCGPGNTFVTCTDYTRDEFRSVDVIDVNAFLEEHRPSWSEVRWINVDGLSDRKILGALARKYELHPLAVEDMMRAGGRPKAEFYPGDAGHLPRLFIAARMISLRQGKVHCEQISFFLGRHTLLTFQEDRGDVWDLVRERISRDGSALRENDTSFLTYALLDAIVDSCFPVMDYLAEQLEEMEAEVLQRPTPKAMHRARKLKHEILVLRREMGPMREVVASLLRSDENNISDAARLFLRDVHDHCIQVIELLETYRDLASGLSETYLNAINFRLTQVMKVLTIISTLFMPLSFLAGVYGMNFPNMPELERSWFYPAGFWGIVLGIVGSMLLIFRRNRWI